MIQVRNLCKSFGRVDAVRNLSFDAPAGSITGLLGRNGAGKSTTLRMVAGVLTPSSGTVSLDTSDDGRGPARQQIGALLDEHGLYPRLTAREHLIFFGRLRGLSPRLLAERVDTVLSMLRLASLADRRAGGFSQGERMTVSLACAIIHDPGHLLLDEATNGLDVPMVRALREVLRGLRERGTCIVFSSHVLSEVEELCDRLVVIDAGALVAAGTAAQLCSQAGSRTLEEAFVRLTEKAPC